ncbi:MAG: N-acetylmuramoyl-L-alanine amidase [Gammaproteobacteria bacterium]|nr:N-acetylmuramoyl-L-alanine amidase [Gammaproteobacteria bacterium]
MRKLLILLAFMSTAVYAAPVEVEGVRLWESPDGTRVVLDLSAPVEHNLFSLEGPDRLVVDIDNASLDKIDWPEGGSLIRGFRSAPRDGNDLRVVLDLNQSVRPRSFVVPPQKQYGYRLVLDLEPQNAQQQETLTAVKHVDDASANGPREIVVAVDAGHGGEDPGALGRNGTREKDIALAIAKELASRIDAEPGMRAVLIRTGDYFLQLSERREKARRANADMFVSIHADGFPDPRARGASVYAVSERGATSEAARILAERENAADLVGGVSLKDKDDVLASVLVDLSKTATMSASLTVGQEVLDEIGGVAHLHKRTVQQAGFVVLKSPDVPSILVESAYISNPKEESMLRTRSYQQRLAGAILNGVRDHFYNNPPPGTMIALWQGRGEQKVAEHAVRRGETLSGIARQYKVSLDTLRRVNGKNGDQLRVGERLTIPLGS